MSKGYRHPAVLLIAACFAAVAACTTATYGQDFQPFGSQPDTYQIKIYVGGFSGTDTADDRAKQEIARFMQQHGYSSYTIVNETRSFIPSYFLYTVQFVHGS